MSDVAFLGLAKLFLFVLRGGSMGEVKANYWKMPVVQKKTVKKTFLENKLI